MKTCPFTDFMKALDPWLVDDYIRKAFVDDEGRFRLIFTDGGETSYRIDDCTRDQIAEVIRRLQAREVPVETGPVACGPAAE